MAINLKKSKVFEPKSMLLDHGERAMIRQIRQPGEGMYTVILEHRFPINVPSMMSVTSVDALNVEDAIALANREWCEDTGSDNTYFVVAVFAGELVNLAVNA